ncbi:MAG: DegT/DnrJ/EryC1/StrS family aminotransferase, partial [Candidatus Rokubacteria bacterium]|nr:DegT/DnrJ/EryC1/StrS family aminotransferase [Candidatus Rokubacteria bacterium]
QQDHHHRRRRHTAGPLGGGDRPGARDTQAREPAPHYEHTRIGHNYRLSNIAAAIGRGQLIAIEDRVARRRAIFDHYVKRLGALPGIAFTPSPPGAGAIAG